MKHRRGDGDVGCFFAIIGFLILVGVGTDLHRYFSSLHQELRGIRQELAAYNRAHPAPQSKH